MLLTAELHRCGRRLHPDLMQGVLEGWLWPWQGAGGREGWSMGLWVPCWPLSTPGCPEHICSAALGEGSTSGSCEKAVLLSSAVEGEDPGLSFPVLVML